MKFCLSTISSKLSNFKYVSSGRTGLMSAMNGCKQYKNCSNYQQIQKLYLEEKYHVDVNIKDERGKKEFKNSSMKIISINIQVLRTNKMPIVLY